MSFNDPISDLLTRVRNGQHAQHRFVDIDWSKMKESLASILKDEGFIDHFLVKREGSRGTIRLFLRYAKNRKGIIHGLKRVSKPGCRKYVAANEIRNVFGGMGISILSTSKGVMTNKKARNENVGGELLCHVW